MSEERELRAVLEKAQARLRDLETKSAELERRRNLAELRARELETELDASRERVRQLEATGGAALSEELERLMNRIGTLELQMKQADARTPHLSPGGVCRQCGSTSLLRKLILRADMPGAFSDANVLLKGRAASRLAATVCSNCGHAELTAEAPSLL